MSCVDTTPRPDHASSRTLREPVRVRDGKWWLPGTLRAWDTDADGRRVALVTWSSRPGEFRIDRVPAERVRTI